METISEIIGGAQALLPLEFELQDFFPEPLNCEHRAFLHHLRVIRRTFAAGLLYPWAKDGPSLWKI